MLKFILTGLGNRGRYWLDELLQHDGAAIAACVEPDERQRKLALESHDVSDDLMFGSLDEAIASTDAACVLDVTPPAVHHEIARKAFDAGLHLLSEKPLSDDLDRAGEIVDMGRAAGVVHMVAQNYRFNCGARTLRRLLAEGTIGRPGQCDVRFYMPWADLPGSHYVTEPYMVIVDMMVHHFDLMRYFMGADPRRVHAVTWNHEWGWHKGDAAHSIVFDFGDGRMATHVANGCSVGHHDDYFGNWRIEGPAGSLSMTNNRIHHAHIHRVDPTIDRMIEPGDPPGHIIDEFARAIAEDRPPECSAEDNLKTVAMVFAAVRSAREHAWIEIE